MSNYYSQAENTADREQLEVSICGQMISAESVIFVSLCVTLTTTTGDERVFCTSECNRILRQVIPQVLLNRLQPG